MAVNWAQNPYQGRVTPFYQTDDAVGPYDGSAWTGGVGDAQQSPDVGSMFAPAVPGASVGAGAALLGGDQAQAGTQPMDYPSPDAIARRRKLAEALMGNQQEVNSPWQAIGNATSQIAGAYLNKKADDDQKAYEKHRRDVMKQSFDAAGGDMDKLIQSWANSDDPDLVDKAYEYQMKKMMSGAQGADAPTVKTIYRDGKMVSVQWDPRSQTWIELGSAPRWKEGGAGGPTGGTFGDDGAGDDPGDSVPTSVPAGGAGKGLPGPGPRGRRAPQKGQNLQLADGTVVATVYNPNDGKTYYQAQDGWHSAPFDARPVAVSTGGMQTPQQWVKLRERWQQEKNGLEALDRYFNTVKDIPTGVNRWAIDVSAKFKTFWWGGKQLTPNEFNKLDAQAQAQALLGLFRTTIVGPGVMTEYDAVRVLNALGGDPGSALQNPQILYRVLSGLYERKYKEFKVLDDEVIRNGPTYGFDPSSEDPISPTLGGGQQGGSRPSEPWQSPSGGATTRPVLKPANQRQKGETTVVNGKTYVWTGTGWVPK